MSKQTAVEFLIDWVENSINISTYQQWLDIKDQALAMEREQIEEAYIDSEARYHSMNDAKAMAKHYYEQTYGKEATDANG